MRPAHAGGGTEGLTRAAPVLRPPPWVAVALDEFAADSVMEDAMRFYRLRIPLDLPAVRVLLVPLAGDADLFLSFRGAYPSLDNATWVMDGVGVEELLVRRASDDFCEAEPCVLYMTIIGYEPTRYRLIVNAIESPATILRDECAPKCATFGLSDGKCDDQCNTTACNFDSGDCLIAAFGAADLCRPGCPRSWIGDRECDEACYNEQCRWDGGDCEGSRQRTRGRLPGREQIHGTRALPRTAVKPPAVRRSSPAPTPPRPGRTTRGRVRWREPQAGGCGALRRRLPTRVDRRRRV